MAIDFNSLFTRMNDPAFLEQLADSPIDPNAIMNYSLDPGTGQEGLQMPGGINYAGQPPGTGLQPPQNVTPAAPAAGVASIAPLPGEEVARGGPTPEQIAGMAGAGQALTRAPGPQQLEQPNLARRGGGPVNIPRLETGPGPRAPRLGLGELLASFRR